jgi:hypothetical protein
MIAEAINKGIIHRNIIGVFCLLKDTSKRKL